MNTYLTLFCIALVTSLVATPTVRRLAQRYNLLDVPRDDRRVHHSPIPRLGGIAIFLSVVITFATVPLVDTLVTLKIRNHSAPLLAVFASSALVFLFGVYDDLYDARIQWKFLAQIIAGALLYWLGGRIGALSLPMVGAVPLPPIVGFAVTILWVVGISNAFNLIDGMDGLAAGASLFASLVMLGISFVTGNVFVTVATLILAGSLIGFLRYNFNPASIFLGDSGSLFIGFTLGALSVTSSQKASTVVAIAIPLMAFGLPIVDTGFAIGRRLISGKPIFKGDKDHIHHKLLAMGWSQRRVAFVLYGVCAVLGLLALMFVSNSEGRMAGLMLLVLGAAVVLVAGRLRYNEVDEVKAGVRRNLGERRIRVANHVHIRHACQGLADAQRLAELLEPLREILDLGEFIYAIVEFGQRGDDFRNRLAFQLETDARFLREAKIRNGTVHWEWERGDIESEEIVGSGCFWEIRLPLCTDLGVWGYINFYGEFGGDGVLLDINYLSQMLQKEMAFAVERIFSSVVSSTATELEQMSLSY